MVANGALLRTQPSLSIRHTRSRLSIQTYRAGPLGRHSRLSWTMTSSGVASRRAVTSRYQAPLAMTPHVAYAPSRLSAQSHASGSVTQSAKRSPAIGTNGPRPSWPAWSSAQSDLRVLDDAPPTRSKIVVCPECAYVMLLNDDLDPVELPDRVRKALEKELRRRSES
jgi:hypothetical protein